VTPASAPALIPYAVLPDVVDGEYVGVIQDTGRASLVFAGLDGPSLADDLPCEDIQRGRIQELARALGGCEK
jgi:hypothetical protein